MVILPKEWSLAYFQTGEWQVIEERLNDLKGAYNPGPALLFRSLDSVAPGQVRVCVVGQDPYPGHGVATGRAFEVRSGVRQDLLPPTLVNIFREYQDDLHYPAPKNGDLTKWCEQGVLLWNTYPSCALGKPGSHHWLEWEPLTKEIVETLDAKANVVFVLLGRVSGHLSRYISHCPVIETSHPAPLGVNKGFKGSRIFSRVNAALVKLKQPPIDWRLDDAKNTGSYSK